MDRGKHHYIGGVDNLPVIIEVRKEPAGNFIGRCDNCLDPANMPRNLEKRVADCHTSFLITTVGRTTYPRRNSAKA